VQRLVDYFIDEPPSVAQRGKGVALTGCMECRKRTNTNEQYLKSMWSEVRLGKFSELRDDYAERIYRRCVNHRTPDGGMSDRSVRFRNLRQPQSEAFKFLNSAWAEGPLWENYSLQCSQVGRASRAGLVS
jgi:hypothetical protein